MRRHIVWAFVVMFVIGIFRHQFFKKSFYVTSRGRGRVLHRGQTATGVLNEDSHGSAAHARLVDLVLNLIGNLVGAFSFGANFNPVMSDAHMVR